MLAISIHIIWVPVILVAGIMLGFIFRSQQITKCKKRILSLENEMLNNHAEILRLQQDQVKYEKALSATSKTPVVSMKDLPQDNPDKEDQSGKKKLL